MEDIGENVSFALAMFEQEDQKLRLSKMYAALLATSEAILRAQTREELFQLVCQGAVSGAKFSFTAVGLARANEDFFEIAAVAGPTSDRASTLKFSPRADLPEGRGLTGTAYRTGRPAVSNDYQQDHRSGPWRGMQNGSQSGAAIPLLVDGNSVGFILFMSQERGTFTQPFVELLKRLAESVSFALESFDRRDQARRAEAQIEHLATHDPLTGLPNRTMFNQLLEQSLQQAALAGTRSAILFIHLDRFKIVNDLLGHAAGDYLLVEVASRLKQSVGDKGIVARLGGDEFVVILNCITGEAPAQGLARDLLEELAPPIELAGHKCRTTASIGIAIYPDNGADAAALTKNADVAMYAAKDDGKNSFRLFSADIKAQSVDRLALEDELRQAIDLEQLVVHYQPKLLSPCRGNKWEAWGILVCWADPDRGCCLHNSSSR